MWAQRERRLDRSERVDGLGLVSMGAFSGFLGKRLDKTREGDVSRGRG